MLDFLLKILRCSNLSVELVLREETAFAVSSPHKKFNMMLGCVISSQAQIEFH
jgi:hypothetical protein